MKNHGLNKGYFFKAVLVDINLKTKKVVTYITFNVFSSLVNVSLLLRTWIELIEYELFNFRRFAKFFLNKKKLFTAN